MVGASPINYISIMVLNIICYRQYDRVAMNFLWDKKNPNSQPHVLFSCILKYIYIAFELSKLAKHWRVKYG